jgi:tRNA (cmo5U34)-methyltransferase
MQDQGMRSQENATPYKAAEYETNVKQTVPYYERFHEETIDLVKTVKPDAHVWLDTGCGTGHLAKKAIPHFPDTLFVLADPCEAMLTEARNRLRNAPADRLRFVETTASESLCDNLALRPDVITAILCHHYLDRDRRREATAACFRLLASGGIYVTFEHVRPHSQQVLEWSLDRWRRFQQSQGRNACIVNGHLERFDSAYYPIAACEHLKLLAECGFHIVEQFWHSQMQAGFYAVKSSRPIRPPRRNDDRAQED